MRFCHLSPVAVLSSHRFEGDITMIEIEPLAHELRRLAAGLLADADPAHTAAALSRVADRLDELAEVAVTGEDFDDREALR